jgi:protein-tyrosine phosphatase
VLWLPTFDTPLLPIPIPTLHRGVIAALGILEDGGSVYAHCAAGVHRSVAMGAAILIATGYSKEEAIHLIKQRRNIADPTTWYIRKRIERFAASWPCTLPDCRCFS